MLVRKGVLGSRWCENVPACVSTVVSIGTAGIGGPLLHWVQVDTVV
ncbi:hypothetical protein RRSWK_03260 [Rhodopirellula sp. SWK7]|nr:hypothetical protein RRSWK_03260 [Rhodopirellula sp. SWK7]